MIADNSSPPASRSPDDPPYRSICWSWISKTHRATGTRVPLGSPQGSLGQLWERLSISPVSPLLGFLEFFPSGRGLRRFNDQLLTIGTDIDRRFGINFEQVEYRTINHECQTVSVFGQLLNHAQFRSSNVSPSEE